jgi:hypothetical protein
MKVSPSAMRVFPSFWRKLLQLAYLERPSIIVRNTD